MASNIIENKTDMIRATWIHDDGHSGQTAGIGAYAGVLAQVAVKLGLIDGLNAVANGTSKGVTSDTKLLKKSMCYLGGKVGQAVAAYANSVTNNTLRAIVDYTEAKLMAKSKDDVDDICEAIMTAGIANILAAGSFGYVAGDNTALGAAIALYRIGMGDPRQAIISKSQAKKQIKLIQKDIVENLFEGQLDKMAYTLKGTANDSFYTGHKQARVIIDLGSTTGKIRGTAKSNAGLPLAGVVFTVYKEGTVIAVGSSTTKLPKATFSVTKLFGKYDVKWVCPGHTDILENGIEVKAGKSVTRNVVMLPV